jgi:3-oxo-5alpha-steroid 4-dehydrogenase
MSNPVVEPPLVVEDAGSAAWSDGADILVVGLGAAGASAAIEARDAGADVLILDRFEGGGATRWSGGIFYAGGTRHQREAGKEESAEEMYRYLSMEVGDIVRPETLRRFCEGSNGDLEWLEGHGVGFSSRLHAAKTTFPDEDKFLYYSGNEKVPVFAEKAKPAPRGHRAVGKSWTGYAISARLKKAAVKGTRQMFHARVLRLVQDGAGRVAGAEVLHIPKAHQAAHQACYDRMDPMRPFGAARSRRLVARARAIEAKHGQRLLVRARKGVVLAAGGFAYNMDMVREHLPHVARTYDSLIRMAALSCDGSGILLGQSVGAATARLGNPFLGRMMTPPNASVQGLMVNARGERFVNEDAYVERLGREIAAQPDCKAWLVVDDAVFRRIRRQALDFKSGNFKNFGLPMLLNILFGGTRKAATLAGLAAKLGIPAGAVEQAVAQNNAAVRAGEPDPVGRGGDNCVELIGGPWRAINNAPQNVFSFMPFFTLGGVKVDEDSGAVLDGAGRPIAGLFAAGRTAIGLCSNAYQSGMSIADCVFSGRRAGSALARANL